MLLSPLKCVTKSLRKFKYSAKESAYSSSSSRKNNNRLHSPLQLSILFTLHTRLSVRGERRVALHTKVKIFKRILVVWETLNGTKAKFERGYETQTELTTNSSKYNRNICYKL